MCRWSKYALHHFPDGESLIRLPPSLPEHVIVCRSLNQPNDKLIELLLCATTARELGAKRLTLVAPYLSYMRQDIANQPGEAVSQRIVGKLLAELFDDVLTVDPHLHRISSLDPGDPDKKRDQSYRRRSNRDFSKTTIQTCVAARAGQRIETMGFSYRKQHRFRLRDCR